LVIPISSGEPHKKRTKGKARIGVRKLGGVGRGEALEEICKHEIPYRAEGAQRKEQPFRTRNVLCAAFGDISLTLTEC
jgi:hypothetical protein